MPRCSVEPVLADLAGPPGCQRSQHSVHSLLGLHYRRYRRCCPVPCGASSGSLPVLVQRNPRLQWPQRCCPVPYG
jgi:hypothetical protein